MKSRATTRDGGAGESVSEIVIDPIEFIEHIIEAGDDAWEALVSAGIQAGDSIADAKWVIGDAACIVAKLYGIEGIERYAKAVKQAKRTVQNYRTVANYWDRTSSLRKELVMTYENITWTHMMIAARIDDMEDAVDFVRECGDKDWTTDQAEYEYKARCGTGGSGAEKLIDRVVQLAAYDGCDVTFELMQEDVRRLAPAIGRPYRLVVYAVKEDAE